MIRQADGKILPAKNRDELWDHYPKLKGMDVEFWPVRDRDSSNMFPSDWEFLAKLLYEQRERFSGFVVAHGTDTMAYTATAVAFALGPAWRKPVVFTGAQVPPDVVVGDAQSNLYRACEVALTDLHEVVIFFGSHAYRACQAQKKDDRHFEGFHSPSYPPLAVATQRINVNERFLRELRDEPIILRDSFSRQVATIRQSPGMDPKWFEDWLSPEGKSGAPRVRGIIYQTLGAGNVPSVRPYSVIPFIRNAVKLDIPVVITSQYGVDPKTHELYRPGIAPIEAGAISSGGMTTEAADVKLRWVLAWYDKDGIAATGESRISWVTRKFGEDFVGETKYVYIP
jgi:L-asparaginase